MPTEKTIAAINREVHQIEIEGALIAVAILAGAGLFYWLLILVATQVSQSGNKP